MRIVSEKSNRKDYYKIRRRSRLIEGNGVSNGNGRNEEEEEGEEASGNSENRAEVEEVRREGAERQISDREQEEVEQAVEGGEGERVERGDGVRRNVEVEMVKVNEGNRSRVAEGHG